MSEILPDEKPFPGRRAAIGLGAGLLVAFVIVLGVAIWDNARRTSIETTADFTAVGDDHYYSIPSPAPAPPFPPIAALHGTPLYPIDFRLHEYHADDMTRAGVDDRAGYIIYRAPVRAKDEDDRKHGEFYYIKVSPKEYLKVKAGAR